MYLIVVDKVKISVHKCILLKVIIMFVWILKEAWFGATSAIKIFFNMLIIWSKDKDKCLKMIYKKSKMPSSTKYIKKQQL